MHRLGERLRPMGAAPAATSARSPTVSFPIRWIAAAGSRDSLDTSAHHHRGNRWAAGCAWCSSAESDCPPWWLRTTPVNTRLLRTRVRPPLRQRDSGRAVRRRAVPGFRLPCGPPALSVGAPEWLCITVWSTRSTTSGLSGPCVVTTIPQCRMASAIAGNCPVEHNVDLLAALRRDGSSGAPTCWEMRGREKR